MVFNLNAMVFDLNEKPFNLNGMVFLLKPMVFNLNGMVFWFTIKDFALIVSL